MKNVTRPPLVFPAGSWVQPRRCFQSSRHEADLNAPSLSRWNNFLVLPENRLAVRAVRSLCRAVEEGKRPPANPLVLHGLPGTGKSHLLAGLAAQLTRSPQGLSLRTVAAGDLVRGCEDDFTDTRDCDVLALEDVQHLDSRTVTMVCDWIDQRLARRQATIVSANAGPGRLRGLPYRFTSRLAGGLVVQLQPLSVASRRRILAEVAQEKNLALAKDALDWLAEQASGGGLRLALGLLQTVALTGRLQSGPLGRADVERIVASSGLPTLSQPDVGVIVKMVAESFGLSPEHLLGTSRLPGVVRSRQVAMYLARELTTLSLPRLGLAFGRDHSTVLHACRKVEQEIGRDVAFAQRIRELRSRLQ